MKKVLKYTGVISLVLSIGALILMMATSAVTYTGQVAGYSKTNSIPGVVGIFGGTEYEYNTPWAGLISWILLLLAIMILILGVLIPILKVKGLTKFAGVLNICAVCLLLVAGLFMFFEKSAWLAVNGDLSFSAFGGLTSGTYALGVGWIIAGVVAITSGVFALLPAVADFLSKK